MEQHTQRLVAVCSCEFRYSNFLRIAINLKLSINQSEDPWMLLHSCICFPVFNIFKLTPPLLYITGTSDSDFAKVDAIMDAVDVPFICLDVANGYSEHVRQDQTSGYQ